MAGWKAPSCPLGERAEGSGPHHAPRGEDRAELAAAQPPFVKPPASDGFVVH